MVLDVNVRERQVNGMKTLQLETLGASAFQCFDKVTIVTVCLPCFVWTCFDVAVGSCAREHREKALRGGNIFEFSIKQKLRDPPTQLIYFVVAAAA